MPTIVNTAVFIKADSNSNGSVTLVIPSGGQAGDTLCACIASSDTLNPSSLSASGWSIKTENYTTTNGSNAPHMALITRPWTGSDPVTVNIGADLRDDHGFIMLVRGADTSNPVSIISPSYAASNTTNYTSQGLTTVAANSLMVGFCASKNGAASYANDTNGPSGMTVLYNRRTRNNTVAIRIAIATQTIAAIGATGTRLWPAFNDTVNYTAAFNFIINASAVTESITSVNSGAGITAGSTGNTAQLAGYSTTPTSATHGPLAMTGLSYDGGSQVLTFDCPAYADGQTRPPFDGVADFTVANGTQSATLVSVPTNPPPGWAQVTISSPNTTDPTYIGAHTDITDHEIAYETKIGESDLYPAEGLVVATDGGVSIPADLAGEHTMYKRNLSTGVLTRLVVTINEASEVVIDAVINSVATVRIGGTSAVTVSDFDTEVSSGSIDGIALTAASNTSITIPSLVDTGTVPRPGTRELSLTGGFETATTNVPVLAPTGYTVYVADSFTEAVNGVAVDVVPVSVADGDFFLYQASPASGKTTEVNELGIVTNHVGTQTLWHISVSTNVARSFNVTTGGGAAEVGSGDAVDQTRPMSVRTLTMRTL